ncbi:MAG: lipoprotein [Patescibacteria group bacterium]|nr:lipoprotein [Patescibacteria group bacterium]
MKAKTKRRIKHVLTKKKLVTRKTSKSVLRTFLIGLATISFGSLAYAITMTKPTINVAVHSSAPGGKQIAAPTPPPTPTPAAGMVGRGSWYALGLPAPDALTCASRTYPRGSSIQVTNLRNGRTMVCRVNDYGPEAWTGRIIDLSRGSFREVEDLGAGTIPVELKLVSGPTGLNLPLSTDYAAIVGYSLCKNAHTSQFCDAHRQE